MRGDLTRQAVYQVRITEGMATKKLEDKKSVRMMGHRIQCQEGSEEMRG